MSAPGGCLVLGEGAVPGEAAPRGSALGGCLLPGGTWWTPPGRPLLRAVRVPHPTGMHSCCQELPLWYELLTSFTVHVLETYTNGIVNRCGAFDIDHFVIL